MNYEESRNARRARRIASQFANPTTPELNSTVNSTDATLGRRLGEALAEGAIGERDRYFAQSLLDGFRKYGSFTDRQRPHVERLLSGPSAPVDGPDKALGERLRASLPHVAPLDQGFAQSLLNGFDRYGSFTDRQRPYVERIVQNVAAALSFAAMAPKAPKAPEKPQATLCPNICSKVNLDGFSRFTVGKLSLTLKNDGSVIWVKWDGRIAGSIDPVTCGYRETRRYLAGYALGEALAALLAVEADPLAAARENGVKTGRCSCCGRPLTDPVSIGYGIGPICRERGFGIKL